MKSTNICQITEHTFDSQLRLDEKKKIRNAFNNAIAQGQGD